MVRDRQKVWMDGGTDGMDGRRQNYIPPTSSGDNKQNNKVMTEEGFEQH